MTATRYAHIISHTHWDREWYLNSPYTNEWLVPFFDALFDVLERSARLPLRPRWADLHGGGLLRAA